MHSLYKYASMLRLMIGKHSVPKVRNVLVRTETGEHVLHLTTKGLRVSIQGAGIKIALKHSTIPHCPPGPFRIHRPVKTDYVVLSVRDHVQSIMNVFRKYHEGHLWMHGLDPRGNFFEKRKTKCTKRFRTVKSCPRVKNLKHLGPCFHLVNEVVGHHVGDSMEKRSGGLRMLVQPRPGMPIRFAPPTLDHICHQRPRSTGKSNQGNASI